MPTPEELDALLKQGKEVAKKDKKEGTGFYSRESRYSHAFSGATAIDPYNTSKKKVDDGIIDPATLINTKEESAGLPENTGRWLASATNNTGAAIWDILSVADVGDWRVGDLWGIGSATGISDGLNNAFKWIDNTIGDGEFETGNLFSRRAAKARELNQIYNTVNTDNQFWDWALNGTANLTGSITGNVLGIAATGGLGSIASIPKFVSAIGGAWLMTQAGSTAIAQDVYDKVYEKSLENADPKLIEQRQKVYEDTFTAHLQENPDDYQNAQYAATQASKKVLEDYAKANPTVHEVAQRQGSIGADNAIKVNGLSFLLNLGTARLGLAGKLPSRNILSNPVKLGTGKEIAKESLQEAIEEGGIENIAEKYGVATGLGKNYGFSNVMNDLLSKEALDQAFWGALGGGIQTAGANSFSYKQRKDQYDEQQKPLKEFEAIMQASGTDMLGELTSLTSTSEEITNLLKQQKALQAQNKHEEAKSISDKMLYNQALHAFSTGTTEKLVDAYESIANDDKNSAEVRAEATISLKDIKLLENTYNDAAKYKNSDSIYINRANDASLSKLRTDLTTKIALAKTNISSEIDQAISKDKTSLGAGRRKEIKGDKPGDVLITQEEESLSYSIDDLFTNKYEGDDKAVYDKFLQDITGDNGIQSVRELRDLENRLENVDDFIYDNNEEYNRFTSRSYQNSLAQEEKLAKVFDKNKAEIQSSITDPNFEAYIDKMTKPFVGKISEERLSFIKNSVIENSIQVQEQIANKKNEKIKEEAAKIKSQKPDSKEENNIDLSAIDEEAAKQQAPIPETIDSDDLFGLSPERSTSSDNLSSLFGTIVSDEDFDSSLFDPLELREDIPQDTIDTITAYTKDYVDSLHLDLGRQPTFEDFIKDFIKHQGRESTDKFYKGLVKGWQDNGFTPMNYDAIYNKLFKTTKEIGNQLLDILASTVNTTEELNILVDETIKDTTTSIPTAFTEDNEPIVEEVNSSVYVSGEVRPKMAFINRLWKEEDGEVVYSEEGLAQSKHVDSNRLLDPNEFLPGTQLQISIPTNANDIFIAVDKPDGSTKPQRFIDWANENNISEGSPQWIDRLPMIIGDSIGGVSFVHDTNWYNPLKFGETREGQRKEAETNTREIRNKVYANKGLTVEITSKSSGVYEGIRIPDNKPTVPLSEANPDTIIAVFNEGRLYHGKKEVALILENKKPLKDGQAYDIRRTGTTIRDAKREPTYTAFPVINRGITSDIVDTLTNAVRIYLNSKNNSLSDIQSKKIESARQQVLESTGLDIQDVSDFESFLAQHIQIFRKEAVNEKELSDLAHNKLPTDSPFITIHKGTLVFGISGKNILPNREFIFLSSNFLENPTDADKIQNTFKSAIQLLSTNILPKYSQNTHNKALQANNPVVTIDNDLNVEVKESTYVDHLMNTLESNMKSFNIGTQENPIYVSRIQPVITYEAVDTKKTPKEKTTKEIVDEIKEDSNIIKNSSNLEQIIEEAEKQLNWLEDDIDDTFYDPKELQDEDVQKLVAQMLKIPGLSPIHQDQIVDYTYNQILGSIDFEKGSRVNKGQILADITKNINTILAPTTKSYKENQESLQGHDDPRAKRLVNKYSKALSYIDNVKNNISTINEVALQKVYKYSGITETKLDEAIEIISDNGEVEKNYSKTDLEENGKQTSSPRMKRFLSTMQNIDRDGNIATGFLGLPTYIPFDTAFNTIQALLVGVKPDYNTMLALLEANKEALPFLSQVLTKLKNAPNQIQKEFTTTFSKDSVNMEFIAYGVDNTTGKYSLQVYNTNASAITQVIQNKWYNNLKKSPLVQVVNGVYEINNGRGKQLLSQYKDFTDTPPLIRSGLLKHIKGKKPNEVFIVKDTKFTKQFSKRNSYNFKARGNEYTISKVDDEAYKITKFKTNPVLELIQGKYNEEGANVLNSWLSEFGISLSKGALKEIVDKGMYYKGKRIAIQHLFLTGGKISSNSNAPFELLAASLQDSATKKNPKLEDNNPLKQGVFKALAKLESKYDIKTVTNAFRDGSKSIYGYTVSKFITDRERDLKSEDSTIREQLLSTSFSSNSMWLNNLTDIDFREKFQISYLGINAIKELGKKLYTDHQITTIADSDHELTKLGLFQDLKQGEHGDYKGIPTRMARMFSPTMSDKSNMTLIKTSVLNLKDKHFAITPRDDSSIVDVGLTDPILDILYEQTILPELRRILKFNKEIKSTNIKGYDKGADKFLLMPFMNTLEVDIDGEAMELHRVLKQSPEVYNEEWISNNLLPSIREGLHTYMQDKLKKKLGAWQEANFIDVQEKVVFSTKYLDSTYLDKFITPDLGLRVKMSALDFIINQTISNANSFMVFAGDPALYYKSREKYDFVKMSQDTFSNVNKRLANQIAPGQKLNDAYNNKYVHIFLDDKEDHSTTMASNIDSLTKWLDNKPWDQKAWDKAIKEDNIDAILDKYPNSNSYFKNANTDAQEYTTWKEHLYVLENMGRLPDYLSAITPNQIAKAREILEQGTQELTKEEKKTLALVFQPIKPVYTGQLYDEKQDVMRTLYIKSSSFPLLPQVTKGLQLDSLRVAMEKLEEKGKTVRASFQSANKVGALTKPLKMFDAKGDMLALDEGMLEPSSLILDRSNFRIQLDVPFKSAKKKEDTVSIGTQTMKLLFNDGAIDLDGYSFNGKEYTGKELHKIYNDSFTSLIDFKTKELYNELGIDFNNGLPKDPVVTAKKIQKLLKEEAEGRGYPKQDIEALTLIEEKNSRGEVTGVTFNLPIWSSANSNRFEALLTAIVTNRVAKIKLPGTSFVAGSQEGFRLTDSLKGIDQNRIIFTSKWEGELKGAEFHDTGKFLNIQYSTNENADLSNFAKRPFVIGGEEFNSVEQYFQLQKFRDSDVLSFDTQQQADRVFKIANKIHSETNPYTIKKLGRTRIPGVKFNEGYWKEAGKKAMFDAVYESFRQNDSAKTRLFSTKNKVLTHPQFGRNDIWGKEFPKILMEVRELLAKEEGVSLSTTDDQLKKTQVLLPSKLRNNKGELLDLFEKKDGEYIYVSKTDKGFTLKEDMIDPDLLSNVSFRIPTSGHMSMAQVEIVGILPYNVGDLMVVPGNLTTQLGLDFDIDKQTNYQLWHNVNEDGRVTQLQDSHEDILEAIKSSEELLNDLKEFESELVQEVQDTQDKLTDLTQSEFIEPASLVDAILKQKKKELKQLRKEDIGEVLATQKQLKKLYEKLLHNEVIKVHSSVLSNPKMQPKISKVLSIDFAKEQANLIDGLINTNRDDSYWSPLDDEYQKENIKLGAAGKVGIGAYSIDVVFHSLSTQNKTLQLLDPTKKGKVAKHITFGKLTSNGTLGNLNTLDKNRTIADVLAERQNIATDNAKEVIMGRVNIGPLTLDVDKVLNLLGFDKGEDGNSISMLFLSQPIIRDYVRLISNSKASTAEYDYKREEKIIDQLKQKYGAKAELTAKERAALDASMTNKRFITEIKAKKPIGYFQGGVLDKFLELKGLGEAIRKVQGSLNTDSKGIGKSIFDGIEKLQNLEDLYTNKAIKNATSLVGDYVEINTVSESQEESMYKEGYIKGNQYYIKPNGLVGSFNAYTLVAVNKLWNDYFPFTSPIFKGVTDEVLEIMGKSEASSSKKVELKQNIVREIKKYINSSNFDTYTLTPKEERARLFIDSDSNTSLAKYISNLLLVKDNKAIDLRVKTNTLIGRFEFDLNKNNNPSLIKFNNAVGEDFDEDQLYNSIFALMEKQAPLPKYNGKPYNTRMLAQDLINYSLLEGGVQQAVQFSKFIPATYLNKIGYGTMVRNIDFENDREGFFGLLSDKPTGLEHAVSKFTMQFAQHNPQLMPKLTDETILLHEVKQDGILEEFDVKLKGGEERVIFLSKYDSVIPKGQKKFQLYYYDGSSYKRIPVLGVFGMNEYNPNSTTDTSLVNKGKAKPITKVTKSVKPVVKTNTPSTSFGVGKESIRNSMTSIANSKSKFSLMARKLLPYVDDSISIKLDNNIGGRGKFRNKEIFINGSALKTSEDVAQTFIHEVIHSITVPKLREYFTISPATGETTINPDAPKYVQRLNRLYNSTVKHFEATGERVALLQKLKDKYLDPSEDLVLDSRERRSVYGSANIFEFITLAMTSPEFQKEMESSKFRATKDTLWDRFKSYIKDFLSDLGVVYSEDNVAVQAIDAVFTILDTAKKESTKEADKYKVTVQDKNTLSSLGIVDVSSQEFTPDMFDIDEKITMLEDQGIVNKICKN